MVAVRVLETKQVWHPGICSMVKIERGQVIGGEQAVFLLASAGRHVEAIDEPAEPVSEPGSGDSGADDPDPDSVPETGVTVFDPSQHSGPQVIAYARDHPDEAAAIRRAEADPATGKQRTTVLSTLPPD